MADKSSAVGLEEAGSGPGTDESKAGAVVADAGTLLHRHSIEDLLPRDFTLQGTEFKVFSPFEPAGDQPQAIAKLAAGIKDHLRYQTLLGVTGSGKTYTMAKVIEAVQKPTLVMAPNKTLAAQLASEFKEFFPNNAVVYFVSYYDYYQPEAYVPASDTFIEKDASINEEVEKLRHAATAALLSRRDVIVVASVSCIYGLGKPEDYLGMAVFLNRAVPTDRDMLIRALVDIQYDRNDYELLRGTFRVRGDAVDIFPPYADHPLRVELFGDEIERIAEVSILTGEILQEFDTVPVWPASHYVTERPKIEHAIETIQDELADRLIELRSAGKLLEAQRLEMRTMFDLEMLANLGFTSGIENYSRHLDGRDVGEPPFTLIDYFPADFLCIIDESHVTVPQIRGMHEGDRSRKVTLVEHGFRLPSALDNRPLRFDEFEQRIPQFVYVSATPGDYEGRVDQARVEQIIRPTGLLDPEVVVRPIPGQIDDIIEETRLRTERQERVLITTLTKRMAEDLADHLLDQGINARYMHSDIGTLERVEILRDLRKGTFDVLVGINLLREGLDLPEVSLVAILDADKEGFLRNHRSLIQTIGRAARNVSGQVIMYADVITASMRAAIDETQRRREIQMAYNTEHNIEPQTIRKAINDIMQYIEDANDTGDAGIDSLADELSGLDKKEVIRIISSLENEMALAAEGMDFEAAARLRDQIVQLRARLEGTEEKDVLEALRRNSRRSAPGPARRKRRTRR
ncbi:MAG: excinuclease ABC subunit UvrB [Coriobacteriia bacterium]|nr:excinuclease ABC subunit UvrB [Coriobacteriia bacterium]